MVNPEPQVASYPSPGKTKDSLHGTIALSTEYVQKLIDAAGPEYYERVTWHPAYMEARTNVYRLCDQGDVKAVQAACRELWVLVNQIIDGTYVTVEQAGARHE